jgi:hypothetical protein
MELFINYTPYKKLRRVQNHSAPEESVSKMAKKNFSAGNDHRHRVSNYLLYFMLMLIHGIVCKNISAMCTAGF